MNSLRKHPVWCSFLAIVLLLTIFGLQGCTIVKYTDGDKSLIVADIRITGSAIDLSGTIEGVGSLDVNREQGSAEGIAKAAIDAAANPLPFGN